MIKRITYIIGYFLVILGASELIPAFFAYIFDESSLILPFILSSIFTMFMGGGLCFALKDKQEKPSKYEIILFLGIVWFILPVFAALPFLTSGLLINMVDAYFEATSALTTTGSSILINLDLVPKTLLLWRSLLQWQGGILVFIIAVSIMPLSHIGAIDLFKSALPHGEGDALNDRIRYAFFPLIKIYSFLTLICFVFLKMSGMGVFDAATTAMSTLSSGGFVNHSGNDMNSFSLSAEIILIPFMIFAATNMTFHWLVFSKGQIRKYGGDPEFKYFCTFGFFAAIFIFFTFIISGSLGDLSFFEGFIKSLFISFSSMSTTGFFPDAMSNMPLAVIIIVIILLFLGGSTGSTAGGFKILRIKILMRHANKEISRLAHPHSIVPIRWNDINVSPKALRTIWSFLFIFLTAIAFIGIAYGALGYDFQTSIGLTTANLFSAGGLIGLISPDFIGYHSLSEFGKWFTSFVMIIGRLEIIAFMMFFIPSFWKN